MVPYQAPMVVLLRQISPQRKIALSGPTQIGRYDSDQKDQWAVPEREQPSEFGQLELIITVARSTKISRNHAAIIPNEEGAYLLDLNSKNGTYLNGENINLERREPLPHDLAEGDIISIARELEFRVEYSVTNNYALLVGAGEDHDGAAQRDIDALGDILEQRGFLGNVKKLSKSESTKQNIYQQLRDLQDQSTQYSHVIFYFHGHGSTNGLSVGGQILNPKELYKKIGKIRGSKAVILDACNTGLFLNGHNIQKVPPDTLVMAASGENQPAGETIGATIAGGHYMGRFTAALIKYLTENTHRLDLRNFADALQQELGGAGYRLHYQQPLIHGAPFTIKTQTARPEFPE